MFKQIESGKACQYVKTNVRTSYSYGNTNLFGRQCVETRWREPKSEYRKVVERYYHVK